MRLMKHRYHGAKSHKTTRMQLAVSGNKMAYTRVFQNMRGAPARMGDELSSPGHLSHIPYSGGRRRKSTLSYPSPLGQDPHWGAMKALERTMRRSQLGSWRVGHLLLLAHGYPIVTKIPPLTMSIGATERYSIRKPEHDIGDGATTACRWIAT